MKRNGRTVMTRKKDKDTRYFVDLDLRKQTILGWDYGNRHKLQRVLANPFHQRIFITEGQYNKLDRKNTEVARSSSRIRSVE